MKGTPEELEAAVLPVVTGLGFDLVDLQVARAGRRRIVRVLADRPTGRITLDECAKISRALAVALEQFGFASEPYVLEVSSPGLDRRLQSPRDFHRYVGETLTLHFADGSVRQGTLKEVDDFGLQLGDTGDRIPFAQVKYGTRNY
jgi:ribosome maturation factor RimP